MVAPLAGAWIEITTILTGLLITIVAPLAGAWIEILDDWEGRDIEYVAPLAGAWIEISGCILDPENPQSSLPSRERGLKSKIKL